MPQISLAHAVARVRVLEGHMIGRERLERLLSASTLKETYKMLEEYGYPVQDGEEAMLKAQQARACALLRELSPQPAVTDCFLLQYDYQNLKLLLKGRCLGQDVSAILSSCGTIPVEALQKAVQEHDDLKLPKAMREALAALEKELALRQDPGRIDTALDHAWIRDVMERGADSALVRDYFTDLIDLTNFRSTLRAQRAQLPREQLRAQLLPMGSIPAEAFVSKAKDAQQLLGLFNGKPYKRYLAEAYAAYQESGRMTRLECLQDNLCLSKLKAKRRETVALEPLIGYFLGKLREAAVVRLVLAGKKNGFSQEVVRERLREMYVE